MERTTSTTAARIAIIGRPNVGKSSLLNMLAGARVSIVDAVPGVTRDRVSVYVDLEPPAERLPRHKKRKKSAHRERQKSQESAAPTPDISDTDSKVPTVRSVEIIDTGGYGVYSGKDDDVDSKALTEHVEYQINQAVAEADVILFLVDAQSGLAPLDYTVAELLRERGITDKVRVIANKVDDESWEPHTAELTALGLGEAFPISATSRHNRRAFLELLYDLVPGGGEAEDPAMRVAIVGKRNAGKSTLVNALAGEERVIVSEIAGTTRDSVDVRVEVNGKPLIVVDTAGVRKRKSVKEDVEYYATHRALRSVRRADVVVLLIDATIDVSQVDKQLSQEIQKHYKPCVIAVNKWDLVKGKTDRQGNQITPEHYMDYLTQELRGLDYAPCVFISAKHTDGLLDVISLAFNLYEQSLHRESTGSINSVLQQILERRGPTSKLGRQAKIYYASQVAVSPPTIVLMVNRSELFEGAYERYLMNRLRDELPFSEIPFRLIFRDRRRVSLNELKAGTPADESDSENDHDDRTIKISSDEAQPG